MATNCEQFRIQSFHPYWESNVAESGSYQMRNALDLHSTESRFHTEIRPNPYIPSEKYMFGSLINQCRFQHCLRIKFLLGQKKESIKSDTHMGERNEPVWKSDR
jgi:hypothetical protein